MYRFLVTGGAGFVGSHFIRLLLRERPHSQILSLDKLTYAGITDTMKDFRDDPRFTFVQGDIGDRALVTRLMSNGVDTVVHFAAESHVDKSIVEPEEFVHTNVTGTFVLLEAARRNRIQRFVHTSTPEVYGSAQPGQRFSEESPIQPSNPYAASKAAADAFCRAYHHTYGIPIVYHRFNNVYGPNQYPEKLMAVAITRALDDKPIPLWGDGSDKRNWIWVEKVCEAILLVAEHGRPGQSYNIGSDHQLSNLDLVHLILDMMRKPRTLIGHHPQRPGADYQYPLDYSKLVTQLGWDPAFDFEGTVRATIEWYASNRSWWENLPTIDYGSLYKEMQLTR